jgi:hypothetical protein
MARKNGRKRGTSVAWGVRNGVNCGGRKIEVERTNGEERL